MPSIGEMVEGSRIFLVEILPQASTGVKWTLDKAEKAFNWAKYCEEMHTSLSESSHLKELDEALVKAGEVSGKPTLFARDKLAKAPLLLLEEFLRNPHLKLDSMMIVMQALCRVYPQSKFESLCRSAIDRKSLYTSAINYIQSSRDPDTISIMKAMIVKEDLLQDLNPSVLQAKLDPLLKSVPNAELLLTVLSLATDAGTRPEAKLAEMITRMMESSAKSWLDGTSRSQTVAALLAVPVSLSRKLCRLSSNFLQSWLDILALLAGRLTPIYYDKDHVWSWPDDDELSNDNRFRGLWFSFDQLVRHMQSLCSSSSTNAITTNTASATRCVPSGLNEDHVTSEALQFLDRQKQLPGLCSLWMEVEQRLSITASN